MEIEKLKQMFEKGVLIIDEIEMASEKNQMIKLTYLLGKLSQVCSDNYAYIRDFISDQEGSGTNKEE